MQKRVSQIEPARLCLSHSDQLDKISHALTSYQTDIHTQQSAPARLDSGHSYGHILPLST